MAGVSAGRPGRRSRRGHKRCSGLEDEGYATVLAASLAAGSVAVAVLIVSLAGGVLDSHRAQVGADLSAVAAASAFSMGQDACEVARYTAGLNHATLVACEMLDADALVTVRVRGRQATARAGQ